MKNVVFVAVRRDGCVGYFSAKEAIPDGWKYSSTQDITNIMASMRCSKEQTLMTMNSHWS